MKLPSNDEIKQTQNGDLRATAVNRMSYLCLIKLSVFLLGVNDGYVFFIIGLVISVSIYECAATRIIFIAEAGHLRKHPQGSCSFEWLGDVATVKLQ